MVTQTANEAQLRKLSKDELQKVCVNLGMSAEEVSSMFTEFGNVDAFLDYVFSKGNTGKDKGGLGLAPMTTYEDCVLAEYVWLDAALVPRSKTMSMTCAPNSIEDLRIWNYDGSSTEQAEGHNSEVLLHPRCIFKDPFRGAPHILVMCDVWNAWDGKPSIGNTRAQCAEMMEKYKDHDPWFGIEQEYTLMKPGKVGETSDMPYGFNDDGSEPAPQGPYYCGAGTGSAIGRQVADDHYAKCIAAGVKIAGTNAEVMPGQWEYQVGPCRGIEMGDHLHMARYIMLRVTEGHGVICCIHPKPREGDWNGAGCHTNFSTEGMRQAGGYSNIIKVCEAFGPVAADHIALYGTDNDKRLTGKHETCSIKEFKYGVANRGCSIRIPREAERDQCGYMEDRRPAANCDPYQVTMIIMKTAGEALPPAPKPTGKLSGTGKLAAMTSYENCFLAEYVWLDAALVPRSKTMTMASLPKSVDELRVWNYDGSSTEQAEGHNSEVLLYPRAVFEDPFRGAPHILVMCDVWNAWDNQPSIGNTRAKCAEIMDKYKAHDPWFGIEQEYTLMKPTRVGEVPTEPYGFNDDGSEPAAQGPYYCSAGTGAAIGRAVADDHYAKCITAGVKIAGTNAEVMPGQWEYQIGPCRGIEMGDHLHMARYIMLRVTESHGVICSISPKPREGDWNGAGCHTNFSTEGMRQAGGYSNIITVCEAFGPVAAEHIALYGAGNDKRLTGKHETCSIKEFKYGVANRGCSIRIPRDAERDQCGYMEDRRPGANCDPYAVTMIVMKTAGEALPPPPAPTGKVSGTGALAAMTTYKNCVLAEYVWLDAHQTPRSKTMTMTSAPTSIADLRLWNYDGSSTEQAEGHNSEIYLKPVRIFDDPFRGAPHILVLAEAINAWDGGLPSIGNTRARCAEIMEKYKALDPWFGIEQEYTLMKKGRVGEAPTQPLGFNDDGSEPAPQGPYYCSAGTGAAIGRAVADEHYAKCVAAGVKIAGENAEVMPGQWEYQVGPCRGIEMGDHLSMARYIMLRVTEGYDVICSISPKPKDGDWNGAGCHTNFSTEGMRKPGGYAEIIKVCEAFGPVAADHIALYGEGNDKRLTGKHETCSIKEFKYGVANRGCSIRIPREAEKNGCGYMEDRRPAANCDPYAVTYIMMKTTGEAIA